MERKLEEAASDWGFRERGPAAEAFYRNRAKLLKQEQRRKEREALKDPLKRMRRFHRVAAGTAALARRWAKKVHGKEKINTVVNTGAVAAAAMAQRWQRKTFAHRNE